MFFDQYIMDNSLKECPMDPQVLHQKPTTNWAKTLPLVDIEGVLRVDVCGGILNARDTSRQGKFLKNH
jgi:hypothetical protein